MVSPGHDAAGSGQYSRTKTTFSAASAYQVTKASFARNNSTLVIWWFATMVAPSLFIYLVNSWELLKEFTKWQKTLLAFEKNRKFIYM
jgi:hypothetical protein